MILDRLRPRRNKPPEGSVLDLPVDDYDPVTNLPERIQVGSYLVKPMVSVDNVRDHLTLLEAFNRLANREGTAFHRLADSSAYEYEYWAHSVLPALLARRAGKAPGAARSNTSASAPVSRPESPWHPEARRAATVPQPQAMTRCDSEPVAAKPLAAHTLVPEPESMETPSDSPIAMSDGSAPFSPMSSLPSSPASDGQPFPGAISRPRRIQLAPHELPTLTVLMCWHAHQLTPAQYAADTAPGETYAALANVAFPLATAAAAIRENKVPAELEHVPEVHVGSISGWRPPDISAAVQRQARMIALVRDLGWLDRAFIAGPVAPFQRAIVRYHAWLDLHAATSVRPLAPTVDIEFVWRTHQLRGAAYRTETCRLLGEPLDRAERGDEAQLRRTAALWQKRFGHDYNEGGKRSTVIMPGIRMPTRRSTVPW